MLITILATIRGIRVLVNGQTYQLLYRQLLNGSGSIVLTSFIACDIYCNIDVTKFQLLAGNYTATMRDVPYIITFKELYTQKIYSFKIIFVTNRINIETPFLSKSIGTYISESFEVFLLELGSYLHG